ncbi:MAG: Uma2 family endonuclease, partial [Moorea sp. SIO2B7]|nr:Uma2 family endonuclease [Moorena sp. SIO2B7]
MEEYRSNGARLGWLIDPNSRQVYIYRPGVDVEQLDNPATVKGDELVVPGFVLKLDKIW